MCVTQIQSFSSILEYFFSSRGKGGWVLASVKSKGRERMREQKNKTRETFYFLCEFFACIIPHLSSHCIYYTSCTIILRNQQTNKHSLSHLSLSSPKRTLLSLFFFMFFFFVWGQKSFVLWVLTLLLCDSDVVRRVVIIIICGLVTAMRPNLLKIIYVKVNHFPVPPPSTAILSDKTTFMQAMWWR